MEMKKSHFKRNLKQWHLAFSHGYSGSYITVTYKDLIVICYCLKRKKLLACFTCTDFSGTLESLRHHTVYTKTVGLKFVSVMLIIILDTF